MCERILYISIIILCILMDQIYLSIGNKNPWASKVHHANYGFLLLLLNQADDTPSFNFYMF
jgi:hypothetical protein